MRQRNAQMRPSNYARPAHPPAHPPAQADASAPSRTSAPSAKTAPKGPPKPTMGKPSAASLGFLLWWHGMLGGGFFVAMISGYGAYNAHSFAGIVTIFAIGARLLIGAAFPKGHVLSFPIPSFSSLTQGTNGVRRFISHMLGVVMLAATALACLTGWFAWSMSEAHSYMAYLTLAIIGGHVGVVILFQGWKKAEAFVRARP